MSERSQLKSLWLIPALCCLLAAAMVGLSYVSSPLYEWFVQAAGYRGTKTLAPGGDRAFWISDREVVIRFDANISEGLDLRFEPGQISMPVRIGEQALAYYVTENPGEESFFGMATFNVAPLRVGAYVSKIECFCFSEHMLKPGETVEMPISFYIDPAIEEDAEMNDIQTITFSYTFFETAPWSNKTETDS